MIPQEAARTEDAEKGWTVCDAALFAQCGILMHFQLTGPSNSRIGQAGVMHTESESQFHGVNVMTMCKCHSSRKANAAREYLDKHNLVEFTQLLVQSASWLNIA